MPVWDLSAAVTNGSALSTPGNWCVTFSPDGLNLYTTDRGGKIVYWWTLTTAWDLSTASSAGSFSVAAQVALANDVVFNATGTKMYLHTQATPSTFQYTLSTAWDVTTASYASKSFAASGGQHLRLSPDGVHMLAVNGPTSNIVYEYALGTAEDITTAVDTGRTFTLPGGGPQWNSLMVRDDGLRAFFVDAGTDVIAQYDFGTPWDVSTLTAGTSITIAGIDTAGRDVWVSPNGQWMYLYGSLNSTIYRYLLGIPGGGLRVRGFLVYS